VREFLLSGGAELESVLAELFTDILQGASSVPQYWKLSKIRVLFKKGDPKLPENYWPICIIPIMYKLFSKIIFSRIRSTLIAAQSCDQAGFRPKYSCDNHLFTVTMLGEKLNEYGRPCWLAALDFKKAFDSIEQSAIWEALEEQGVERRFISILQSLYEDQRATVQTDETSRSFGIFRGTKQGDPISPVLFNAVVESFMRKLQTKWATKKWGVQMGSLPSSSMTNLRFADDILLIGKSLPQIRNMLSDVVSESAKIGLELHPGKTKILHNGIGYGSRVAEANCNGMSIQVLDCQSQTMYLGRALRLTDTHDIELQNRTAKAWAKFSIPFSIACGSLMQSLPLRSYMAAVGGL
jgi:hypothetical protein